MYKRVHVIINPASGQDRPILGTLSRAFQESSIEWEIYITKKGGDARRFAETALAAGADVVAVYGGDGTVAEVARALAGTEVPLAILPGGTANVLSVELGIPKNLANACDLLCRENSRVQKIDLGRVGNSYFMLSTGIGFAAALIGGADRKTKLRFGMLAYFVAAVRALRAQIHARYQLTLDGKQIETDGVTCMIINCGNLGLPGVKMAQAINVTDGLLDVVVIRRADLGAIIAIIARVLLRG